MLIRGPRHVRLRGPHEHPEDEADLSGDLVPQDEVPLVPDLLDALLDAVSVGIVVQRPDGRPVCVNAAAKALLGSDPVAALATAAASAMRRGRLQQTVLDLSGEGRPGAHRGADAEQGEVLVTTVPIAPYGGPVAALVSTVSAEPEAGQSGDGESPERVVEAAGGRLQRALLRAEQHMLALTEHSSTGLGRSRSTDDSYTSTPLWPGCWGALRRSSPACTCTTSRARTEPRRSTSCSASPPASASGSTWSGGSSG